jgi:hypothetical protein
MRICCTDGSAEASTSGRVLHRQQVARHATREEAGDRKECHYVRHDRDQKFCADFRETLVADRVDCVLLARSPI